MESAISNGIARRLVIREDTAVGFGRPYPFLDVLSGFEIRLNARIRTNQVVIAVYVIGSIDGDVFFIGS